MPKYIDIHSHVNFTAFDADRDEVIKRALENDTWVINVGTQVSTSEKAIELAHQYKEGVYAIIGLHPIHTDASFMTKKNWVLKDKNLLHAGKFLIKMFTENF